MLQNILDTFKHNYVKLILSQIHDFFLLVILHQQNVFNCKHWSIILHMVNNNDNDYYYMHMIMFLMLCKIKGALHRKIINQNSF